MLPLNEYSLCILLVGHPSPLVTDKKAYSLNMLTIYSTVLLDSNTWVGRGNIIPTTFPTVLCTPRTADTQKFLFFSEMELGDSALLRTGKYKFKSIKG